MKLSSNSIIHKSLLVLLAATIGCATGAGSLTGPGTIGGNPYAPNWGGADIKQLPIADKPEELAKFVWILSRRDAPAGQKLYALRLAQYAYNQNKKNRQVALALAYAAFIVADSEDDNGNRSKFADIGREAAENAGVRDKNPEANYYYALNLGIIVQIKGLFALSKLPDILNGLKTALAKPELDMGGPLRTIGMLYLKAPSWPQGIGDIDEALVNLESAVKNYPSHPQNYIFYAEALIEEGDQAKALAQLDSAEKMAVPEIWGSYYAQKWQKEIADLKKKAAKD